MKYGLNLELEAQQQRGDEWKFGGLSQPCIASIPLEDREKLLPVGEVQRGTEDLMDCASRSVANIAEAKLTFLYRNDKLTPDNRLFLEGNGYLQGDRIVLSDAYVAIRSGTTKNGNSLKAPLDTFRKLGTVPKTMLPLVPSMTFEQYHDPKRITAKMDALAREFAERFTWNYEQVYAEHFADCLKDDFIDVALFAWPEAKQGIYPRVATQPNHAVALFKPRFYAFDNYEESANDFIKQLATDYAFHHYGYRLYLSSQQSPKQSALGQALEALKTALLALSAWIVKEQQAQTPAAPVAPPNNLLNEMCLGIQSMEGWYEGSRSWRNRNPGNLVFVGQPGATKEPNGRFAVFPTYAAGFQALKNMILNAAKGKSKIYYPEMNLLLFFSVYAPSNDGNNPTKYAEHVAKRMGVNPATFTLKQLL